MPAINATRRPPPACPSIYVESAADDPDNPGNLAERLLAEMDEALKATEPAPAE